MDNSLSEHLVEFVTQIRYEILPRKVIKWTKLCLLDFLGSIYSGANAKPSKILKEITLNLGGNPESTIIGTQEKTISLFAALCNAGAGHVVEMDDLHRTSILHPGATIIPAALAIAEREKKTGKDLILAIIAGYEVAIRIGEAVGPSHYEFWHTTGTCGTFGAAIAAGILLELDNDQLIDALGSAGTQSAGLWEFLVDGAMSKQLHTGKAAMNGILDAVLAKKGFTGAKKILEGEKGFFRAMSTDYNLDKILMDMNPNLEELKIMSVSIKPYASCRHTHSSIDATLRIIKKHDLKPDDIQKININIYSAALDLLKNITPTTPYAAKFSLPYCVASAIKYRNVGLANFTSQSIDDPEIQHLMTLIRINKDPELNVEYPKKWPAVVELQTQLGNKIITKVEYPKGDPENPMTPEEIIEKFMELSGSVISRTHKNWLIQQILTLENITDINTLFNNC